MDNVQKKVVKLYACVLGAGLLYTIFIMTTGFGMPCMLHEITGYDCPGCGSSRMFLAAFHGDFKAAFNYNHVAFFAFPIWTLIGILSFIGHPRWARSEKVLLGLLYVTVAVYVIYGILRNFI